MAEVIRNDKVFRISSTVTDEGTNTYVIGDAHDGSVSTIIVWIYGNGATATITPKARPRNPEAAQPIAPPMPATPRAFAPIPFITLVKAGAAVAPPVYGATAIAAADLVNGTCIQIPASGSSIALDVTITAGDAWIYWSPLEGPPAL